MNKKLIVIIFALFLTNTSIVQSASSNRTFSKDLFCNLCSQIFTTSNALERHTRTHEKVINARCSECNQTFAQEKGLMTHRKEVHSGEKPFPCDACNKTFARKGDLKLHTQSKHSGEKPFSCDTCNKTFARKGALKIHIRIHTKSKVYLCAPCNQTFGILSSLKRHKKTLKHQEKTSSSFKRKKGTPSLSQVMKSTSSKRLEKTHQ